MNSFLRNLPPILSNEETYYATRLKNLDLNMRYVAVRTLLRLALSYKFGNRINADEWHIAVNQYGKSGLADYRGKFCFSISHEEDFSLVAISQNAIIGIDAEKVCDAKLKCFPEICLTSNERRKLKALNKTTRYSSFFRLWTLKEAYAKALGLGHSIGFEQIEFDIPSLTLSKASQAVGAYDKHHFKVWDVTYAGELIYVALCALTRVTSDLGAVTYNVFISEEP